MSEPSDDTGVDRYRTERIVGAAAWMARRLPAARGKVDVTEKWRVRMQRRWGPAPTGSKETNSEP